MNPEEFQTPQPTDESLKQKEQPKVEQQESSSVESVVEITAPNSKVDIQNDQPTSAVSSSDELTQESTLKVVTQLEEEITTLGKEVESESQNHRQEQEVAQRIAQLQSQKQALKEEIANLQVFYKTLQAQFGETQTAMRQFVQEALSGLEQRKATLQISVEQLERRQERIRNEMRTTFAGTSQDLAIRVQGFKDYLTGSLQDLAAAAEQLQLVPKPKQQPEKLEVKEVKQAELQPATPQFAQQQFQDTTKQVRRLIDQYRTKPDYYGPAW
ncbi:MAG: DUF3086 domain-containing protein, partial [Brasilonema sp.]